MKRNETNALYRFFVSVRYKKKEKLPSATFPFIHIYIHMIYFHMNRSTFTRPVHIHMSCLHPHAPFHYISRMQLVVPSAVNAAVRIDTAI